MTRRRWLSTLSGFIAGLWPAGLLLGGLDFYRLPGELPFAVLLGLAAASGDGAGWFAGLSAGLGVAFAAFLLAVGAEWHFLGFAFDRALPFLAAAGMAAVVGVAFGRLRGPKPRALSPKP